LTNQKLHGKYAASSQSLDPVTVSYYFCSGNENLFSWAIFWQFLSCQCILLW